MINLRFKEAAFGRRVRIINLITSFEKPSRMINDKEKLELYYLRKARMQFQQLREAA